MSSSKIGKSGFFDTYKSGRRPQVTEKKISKDTSSIHDNDEREKLCALLPPDVHEFTPDLELLRKYFEYLETSSRSHIDSFDYFVKAQIRQIMKSMTIKTVDAVTGKITYTKFDYPIISKPSYTAGGASYKVYPARSLEKHETYAFTVHGKVVSFEIVTDPLTGNKIEKIIQEEPEAKPLFNVPCMTGSAVCNLSKINDPIRLLNLGEDPHDPYGYFIINGMKKALITTEKLLLEKIYVLPPAAARVGKDSAYARITVPTAVGTKQMQVTFNKEGAVCLQLAAFRKESDNKTPRIINVIHIIDIIDHYLLTGKDGQHNILYKRSREMSKSKSEMMKEVGIIPMFRQLLRQFVAPEEWLGVSNELTATEATYATTMAASSIKEVTQGDYEAINVQFKVLETQILQKYKSNQEGLVQYVQKTLLDYKNTGLLTPEKTNEIKTMYEVELKKIDASRNKEIADLTRSRDSAIANLDIMAGDDRRILSTMNEIMVGIGIPNKMEWQNKLLEIFTEEFFPNIPPSRMFDKIIMLVILVAELLRYQAGYRDVDDKNSWANKRIDMPGIEVAKILRGAWSKMFKKAQATINKNTNVQFQAIVNAFDLSLIAKDMEAAFTSSTFGVLGGFARTSLTEILETHNKISIYSMLNKIDVKMDRNSSAPKVRAVQPTQQTYICGAQTTDDSACGIVKNKGCATRITIHKDPNVVYTLLLGKGLIKENKDPYHSSYLTINGYIRGWVNASALKEVFIEQRRKRLIYEDAEIIADIKGKVMIFTNAGRLVVPMLFVDPDTGMPALYNEKDYMSLTFEEMLTKGYVGYLGAAEAEYVNVAYDDNILKARLNMIKSYSSQLIELEDSIAMSSDEGEVNAILKNIQNIRYALEKERIPYHYRHLHPVVILGISGAITVYGNRMQGCRLTYQTKMFRQAMSAPPQNPRLYEGTQKRMLYPTRALVQSGLDSMFGVTNAPLGQNIKLLIASISGYNQEDAIVVNQRAIDAGLFRYFKAFVKDTRLNSINGYRQLLGRPIIHPSENKDIYQYIQEDGLPMIGAVLQQYDCVIGRIQQSLTNKDDVINASIYMGIGEYGIVDSAKIVEDSKGVYIAVRLHVVETAAIGDKFASRFAQKSTIGIVRKPEDMPFMEDGSTPDIIMNPHAIPSRMTMGLLAEMLVGTAAELIGRIIDATSFQEYNEKVFMSILLKYGIMPTGERTFYSGTTGLPLKHTMFSGNVYYQQLLHIAKYKIQARGRGKVSDNTRQPLKGKSQGGGMQVGAMEFRALLEYGGVEIMKNRSCNHSDIYGIAYCLGNKCGSFATLSKQFDPKTRKDVIHYRCPRCNSNKFGRTEIPYVFKYLIQLMSTYNIQIYSLLIEEEKFPDLLESRLRSGDTSLNRKNQNTEFEEEMEEDEEIDSDLNRYQEQDIFEFEGDENPEDTGEMEM